MTRGDVVESLVTYPAAVGSVGGAPVRRLMSIELAKHIDPRRVSCALLALFAGSVSIVPQDRSRHRAIASIATTEVALTPDCQPAVMGFSNISPFWPSLGLLGVHSLGNRHNA